MEFPALVYKIGNSYSHLYTVHVFSLLMVFKSHSKFQLCYCHYYHYYFNPWLMHHLLLWILQDDVKWFETASSTWSSVELHWFTWAETLAQSSYWKWQKAFCCLSLPGKDNAFHRKAVIWCAPLCNSTTGKEKRPKNMRTLTLRNSSGRWSDQNLSTAQCWAVVKEVHRRRILSKSLLQFLQMS